MQEDSKKINSWWQSSWANSYIKTMFFGIALVIGAIALKDLPSLVRLVFVFFGLIIAISSYFAAKSRWKKI